MEEEVPEALSLVQPGSVGRPGAQHQDRTARIAVPLLNHSSGHSGGQLSPPVLGVGEHMGQETHLQQENQTELKYLVLILGHS